MEGTDEQESLILNFILVRQYIKIAFGWNWLNIGPCVGFCEHESELKLNKKREFIDYLIQDELFGSD